MVWVPACDRVCWGLSVQEKFWELRWMLLHFRFLYGWHNCVNIFSEYEDVRNWVGNESLDLVEIRTCYWGTHMHPPVILLWFCLDMIHLSGPRGLYCWRCSGFVHQGKSRSNPQILDLVVEIGEWCGASIRGNQIDGYHHRWVNDRSIILECPHKLLK